jgi:hypothetical protein
MPGVGYMPLLDAAWTAEPLELEPAGVGNWQYLFLIVASLRPEVIVVAVDHK